MTPDSEHLIFRQPQPGDLLDLHSCFSDAETARYWLNGFSNNLKDTDEKLTLMMGHWTKYGIGDWVLTEKDKNRVIGFCGLHFIKDMKEINIGYMLHRSKWGLGYGHESATAAIRYASNALR